MAVTLDSRNPAEVEADLLALLLPRGGDGAPRLSARAAAIDRALEGRVRAVIDAGDFRAKPGETALLYPGEGLPARRLLLVGLGDESALDAEALRRAVGTAVGQAAARRAAKLALPLRTGRRLRAPAAAQAAAEGAVLAGYRFDAYRDDGEDAPGKVESVHLFVERPGDLRAARAAARVGSTLAECQNLARDLSNEPANALPPAELARRAQRVAREVGLRAKVLGPAEMERLGMGALLAVGQGSAHPPRLVILEHRPARAAARPRAGGRGDVICLVGKGITFDSGGISIKPSAGMDEMKHDMSGAAAVIGALRACALLKVPQHVVGIVGAAENMPSGAAYRPGDVLRSMSGRTIEILNTDAEGRVVLADALHYAKTEYAPRAMIDLATLTGACVVALGPWATGMFGNDQRLIDLLRSAGESTSERTWPMPLWEEHRKAMRSEVASVKNAAGREAGSSTAAAFLAAFVDDTPWVHLDIAGTGWTSKPGPYQPRGATGVGVRLLLEALRGWKDARIG
jgi:leucyl aminopeptidase